MKKILLVLSVALAAGLPFRWPEAPPKVIRRGPARTSSREVFVYFGGDLVGSFRTAAPLCNGGVSYAVFFSGETTATDSPTLVFTATEHGSILFDTTQILDPGGVCSYPGSIGRPRSSRLRPDPRHRLPGGQFGGASLCRGLSSRLLGA